MRGRVRASEGAAKKNRPAAVSPERIQGSHNMPVRSTSSQRIFLFGLILTTVTIFAYRPAWNGGLIWDDDVYITKNQLLTAPDGLRRIWFSLDSPSQYFPLTYTTFRMERAVWDLNPTGYHWVNILLHVANALLLWRFAGAAGNSWRMAGGGHLRVTSCSSRIGRVDHGAEKRADGFFLFAHADRVDAVHR
jgi:hypothetical protein